MNFIYEHILLLHVHLQTKQVDEMVITVIDKLTITVLKFLQAANVGKLEYYEIHPVSIYHCIATIELIQQIIINTI